MKAAHRVAAVALSILLVAAAASAQNRVRVINNRSPILSSDLVTPVTYVDASAELILVSEQGDWIEVLLPGLNPRRETGFIARANIGPLRATPNSRSGTAPSQPAATDTEPVPRQSTPESVRRPSGTRSPSTRPVSFLGTGLRGFASVGAGSFLAHESFDAVLGSSKIRGPWVGGGAQFQSSRGLFFEGEIQFFRRTGQRVFVNGATVFDLGIPDTLTLMPINGTVGYRFRGRTIAPFIGGGVGQYLFSEKTPFDEPSEHAWQRANSFHVLGGVEFHAAHRVGVAVEGRYTRVPNALKDGVTTIFDEADLGGFQFGAKVLVGRR